MTDQHTRIETLLSRIDDTALRDQLRRAVDDATEHRPMGLVFEEHLPEAIRIPAARVRRGTTVQYRNDTDGPVWDVQRVRAGAATIARREPDGAARKENGVPVSELIVARRLGDPVYPGLTPLGTIDRGGDKPHHVVIEGENYHALQTLEYTHKGKIDLIYIDPPYNTGTGDWIYNDKYIGEKDSYRHSKWLSFMHRRLTLARELLTTSGVIIVAIGDDEHHRLRMLMDQAFGERNFISNIVWQGGVKNDGRFSGGGVDYMLIYARDKGVLVEEGVTWRVEREGLHEVLNAGAASWRQSGQDPDEATAALKSWWKANKDRFPSGIQEYKYVDTEGYVHAKSRNVDFPGGGGPMYDVFHPVTGRRIKPPSNGWRPPEQTMRRWIAEGVVEFDDNDDAKLPTVKRRLVDHTQGSVLPTFRSDRRSAANTIRRVLGSKDFPYPKDADVIARWLNITTAGKTDAIILDFFAGTGTTAEAVMRLNAEDGGRRQSIIVTNNELAEKTAKKLTKAGIERGSSEWEAEGVFEKVTRPRIETVVTGIRRDGSAFSDGLDENVAFFMLDYLDRDSIEAGAAFKRVAELLWAKAGGIGPVITERTGTHASTDHYAVCFDADRFTTFVDEVNERESIRVVYVVASSEVTFGTVKRALRDDVVAVHLYENYLSNFEINTGAAR